MDAVDIIFKVTSHREGYKDKHTKNYCEAVNYAYLTRGSLIARIYHSNGNVTDISFDLSDLFIK